MLIDSYQFSCKIDSIMKKLDFEFFVEFFMLYGFLFLFILIVLIELYFFEFDIDSHSYPNK